MHPFHDYLLKQVSEALRSGVAVVVDPAGAFRSFFQELGDPCKATENHPDVFEVVVAGQSARKVTWEGSWFAVRTAVEPFFSADGAPNPPLLLYVPTATPTATQHVLMELEKAGKRIDWAFDREARECLRKKFTEAQIDEILGVGTTTYDDVVALLRGVSPTASKLKVLMPGKGDGEMLVEWLANDTLDTRIDEKGAKAELLRLLAATTGLEVADTDTLAKARDKFARYALLAEFRHDLQDEPPSSTASVPAPATDALRHNTLDVVRQFRTAHPKAYIDSARRVEQEFQLAQADVKPDRLGRIDTFEFEERLLLRWCAALLEQKRYEEAQKVVTEREASFWVERADEGHTMPRKEQWELCRRIAQLGLRVAAVRAVLPPASAGPDQWVQGYVAADGWHRVDAAQRDLETWRSRVSEEELAEHAVAVVLRDHEVLVHEMATRFTTALRRAAWTVPGVLHQTRIYPELVAKRPGPVAYIHVDALRYEMGAELARQLGGVEELLFQPAIAALPSITPIGMAALLPGASATFSVGRWMACLAAEVDGVLLPGLPERQKYLAARVPDLVDLHLGTVLQIKPSELKSRVANRSLVWVRSSEIDSAGETLDDHVARQSMDTVIGNLVRAVRKLATAGVGEFVITADHGHLFGLHKGDDMKTAAPGGETLELHRRCWIGRGGTTPPGTVRASAVELGYSGDLEFVFPTGGGVFKAGGDLSFHHGSTSLQEIVIPVLSFRLPTVEPKAAKTGVEVKLENLPPKITNRIFVVAVSVTGADLFATAPVPLRVVLVSGSTQVGRAGMASGAEFDAESGLVTIRPGSTAYVGLSLSGDPDKPVKVTVIDPATGATLASSSSIDIDLMR
jgi:hypothetical protein